MARTWWLPGLVALVGCAEPMTAPTSDGWPWHALTVSGNVQLAGHADLAHDTVRVHLILRNRGSTSARVEFGVCAFAIQGIGRHGAAWDNHPAPNAACADFGLVVELKAGESREFPVYRSSAARILARVPRDYYRVSIYIRQDGVLRRLAAGGLEL